MHSRTRKFFLAATLAVTAAAPGLGHAQTVDPAEKKLLGAEGLLARSQFEAAAQEFDEFLKTYPQDPRQSRAQFGRALAAYNSTDLATAAASLDAVVADQNFPRRDEALALLANIDLSQSKPDLALASLDTLIKDYPKSAQIESADVNRAQALYRLARYEDSLGSVRDLVNNYPKSALRASAYYVAALDQRALGDDAAAATILRDVTANYPNSPFVYDAQLLLGETLAGQGKFDDAIAHYKKLQETVPESRKAAVAFGLAMALSQAGRYTDAEQAFASVDNNYKGSTFVAPAHLQYAVAVLKSGDHAKARDLLAQAAKDFPTLANAAAYQMARADILDNKFDDAKATLERLVKAHTSELADAEFDLAYCELMLGHDKETLAQLEAFRAAYPRSSHTAEALYYEATALHRQGNFQKAVEFCEAAATYPHTTILRQATLLKGESILMLGQYQKADAVFADLEKSPGSEAEKLRLALRRGQCAYFAGDYKSAESQLKQVTADPASATDPVLQEAAFLLGDAQLQQGEDEPAAASLKSFLSNSKTRTDEATFKLALAQIGANDPAAGTESLKQVMAGDLKSQWVQRAWYEFAQLSYRGNNPKDARDTVQKLLAAKPAEAIAAPAMYLLASIEMESADYPAASKQLDQLISDYPKNALVEDAVFTRAVCLKESKHPAEAQKEFAAYLQTYPAGKHAIEARRQSAVSLSALGKPAEAVKALTDLANDKSSRSADVLYDLAWADRTANDTKHAIETYQALLHEFPQSAKSTAARVELPELLYAEKSYTNAAELLIAAINDPATDPHLRNLAIYRLGFCYARLNDPAKAAATFDAFIKDAPKDPLLPDALSESGDAYAQLEKLDEAQRRQSRVLTDFPQSPAAKLALLRLGETQNQAQEYEAAAKTFTDWLKKFPTDALAPRANFGLGWSHENRAQYKEAREAYAQTISTDNGPTAARAQFQIGETYFAEKQYQLATKEFIKADIQYTSSEWSPRALYEAGRAFEQLKNTAQAKQQYTDCLKKFPQSDVAAMAKKRLESLTQ